MKVFDLLKTILTECITVLKKAFIGLLVVSGILILLDTALKTNFQIFDRTVEMINKIGLTGDFLKIFITIIVVLLIIERRR